MIAMRTPEQIAERNGWDGYQSIVDLRDISEIQAEAWNCALEKAASEVKRLSCGLDCDCGGCVARRNDVTTILEQRIVKEGE